ncbi:MAG: TMEM165/GDT1 family protein [bacterium]|nr:TMEM165/GDT1 family protein [bacterium]
MKSILVPFVTILLAEFADKTQLALLYLATRTKQRIQLMGGAVLGFSAVNGLTILFGHYLKNLVPASLIKVATGLFFILFGIFLLLSRNGHDDSKEVGQRDRLRHPFWSALSVIVLSELGDKTNLAAGLFAVRYQPALVFIGVMAALICLSGLTILVGDTLSHRIKPKLLSLLAAILFIILGLLTLWH